MFSIEIIRSLFQSILNNQLGETSSNQRGDVPFICPTLTSKTVVSDLLSYSVCDDHAAWHSKDGKGNAIGDNSCQVILNSLPSSKLEADTEIDMKDSRGNQCKLISILCGSYFILYPIFKNRRHQ